MIHKKMICFIFLFYLFPVSGCMKPIDLTKTPKDSQKLSFTERQAKYEQDAKVVKSTLHERRNARLITGFSPSGTNFLYSLYNAKNGNDFDNALMAKGEIFIQLYAKEQVGECSALGIVILAESVSFQEKQNFIQKLLVKDYDCKPEEKIKHDFKPTLKDKEFAFFAKIKQFGPSIIQEISSKISLIRHMNAELQLLDKAPIVRHTEVGLQLLSVRNYIEELLFLLNLEEKESLL
jgi:hypothetical protein